ncbi:FAD/NAD(P)-binding domain-containing protein [Gonapodya prolifera JEL478]|uniref:FAD/NAD(P)-binding domain-containing protein n=1 Tax=Gonapodya prolifera (strain JEL478) TaxID=1344416 RepID=A0A139ACD0_GONPJ|nr:FAD/NAD(P)-binding domain-containing protein [Gonapodya prolifera JEL478]|eukprot:KXS14319.1 FAD/NAD(P)-binding domain-containing protein [Gonapodya prolifera JEL478]
MDAAIYEKRSDSGDGGLASASDTYPFWEVGGSVEHENALLALEQLGLLDEGVANSGGSAKSFAFFLMDGSDPIWHDTESRRPGGQNAIPILRSSYHGILMHACEKAGIPVMLGKTVVGIRQDEKVVTATFADGSEVTADFLVGADGVNSVVRRLVFPDAKPRVRHGTRFIGVFDLGKEVGPTATPFDNAGAWVLMQLKHPSDGQQPDADWLPYKDLPKASDRLGNIVQGWGAPDSVANAVRYAKRITPIHMWDLPDMATFHKGRVFLVGDAGHGIRPSLGQGHGMTIEDCAVLDVLLDQIPGFTNGQHGSVFLLYDEIRLPRVHYVASSSRDVLTHMTAAPSFQMYVGRLMFRRIVTVRNTFGLGAGI